jgi:signal transduction histidine kinase
MELDSSEILLPQMLENSLSIVKEMALQQGLRLSTRQRGVPATLWGDERKLKQVLYNLLSNAVKFTPPGGTVDLEARGLNGQGVEITVRDSGIGLREADLERIFEPFEQGDNSSRKKFQGTGLGLSLSKRLVEMHGGRIWASSPGPGAGSAFSFRIPATSGEAHSPCAPEAGRP